MPVIKRTDGSNDVMPNTKGSINDSNIASKTVFTNQGGVKELAEKASKLDGIDYDSDDMKYAIATKTAQDRLGGYDDVDDNTMKSEIDSILENELGAEAGTGRRMRGENWFTDSIGKIKDFINGATHMAGEGINNAFDTVVGGGLGLVDEGLGQTAKDLFNADDAAMVADMAADLGLAAIPYAGIPLVVAKNAAQQSDNIAEAISGVDNVTQLDLEGSERFGKGLESALTTGLSAIPGVGKAGNIAKLGKADKALTKSLSEMKPIGSRPTNVPTMVGESLTFNPAKESASVFEDAIKNGGNVIRRSDLEKVNKGKKAVAGLSYGDRLKAGKEQALDLLKRDPEKYAKAEADYNKARAALDDVARNSSKKSEEYIKAKADLDKASIARRKEKSHPLMALNTMRDAVTNSRATDFAKGKTKADIWDKTIKGKIGDASKDRLKSMAASALSVPTALGISELAENGGSPVDATNRVLERLVDDPMRFLAYAMPIGAKGMAKRTAGLKGNFNSMIPMQASRAETIMNDMDRRGENDIDEGMSEDDILKALKLMNYGGSNG